MTQRVEGEMILDTSKAENNLESARDKTEQFSDKAVQADVNLLAMSERFDIAGDAVGSFNSGLSALRGGLEDTIGLTEHQSKQMQGFIGVMDLVEAPMLVAIPMWKAYASGMKDAALAAGALATAALGVGAAMAATNAQSEGELQMFSALAGVTWGLAAAQATLAIVKYTKLNAWQGPALAVSVGILTAALGAAFVYFGNQGNVAKNKAKAAGGGGGSTNISNTSNTTNNTYEAPTRTKPTFEGTGGFVG